MNDKIIPRQSNIELLRIIAMIGITAHHFSIHSGFDFSTELISINRLWILFLQMGGKIGVNIFVLISGYFLITSSALKMNKVIKLWVQIFTYSIIIFVVFVVGGGKTFSIKELITSIFPITYSQYWFASTYFMLYILSPYINRMLKTFDKKTYRCFLVLLAFCWSVIPTFLGKDWSGSNLSWFVFLYSLAGYVRLHSVKNLIKARIYIMSALLLIMMTFLVAVVFAVLGTKYSFFGEHTAFFYPMHRLPALFISFLLFIGFLKINIGYKRIINVISSAMFGVYLIHENEYVRPYIWSELFKNASFAESNILIPYSVIVTAIVFIVCTIIELVRIYVFEKNYMGIVNKISDMLSKYIEKFFQAKIFDKL